MARPRTDIRPRILAAARARFLLEGVEGASLRTIAKDAKTSVGMIFYYFPTKDELFQAVVEEVYAKLLSDLEVALAPGQPVRERIRRASVRLGSATPEELDIVRLVVHEALLSSERFARLFARFQRGHIALVMAALADGVQAGEVDPALPIPVLLASTLGLIAIPQFLRRVVGRAPFSVLPDAEGTASISVDLLFKALAPPKPTPP